MLFVYRLEKFTKEVTCQRREPNKKEKNELKKKKLLI